MIEKKNGDRPAQMHACMGLGHYARVLPVRDDLSIMPILGKDFIKVAWKDEMVMHECCPLLVREP